MSDLQRESRGASAGVPLSSKGSQLRAIRELEMSCSNFKPSYVWPNPAFPFRLYFEHPNCRVFIIENIVHNWNWLQEYASRIRPSDVFFVIVGSYHGRAQVEESWRVLEQLAIDPRQFRILFNSEADKKVFEYVGFQGVIANQNAWLDENLTMRPKVTAKRWDAIYVGRRVPVKRHMLASKVSNLALVAGPSYQSGPPSEVPAYAYLNDRTLTSEEVCDRINEAHCGLILSAREGANFASSEYLLCGVPVVSTPSEGGRDVWYDTYNSIVCEPNEDAVAAAVEYFKSNPRDPEIIRARHMETAEQFRRTFIELLERTLAAFGVEGVNPDSYFRQNFFHKLRKSIRPDFGTLFP